MTNRYPAAGLLLIAALFCRQDLFAQPKADPASPFTNIAVQALVDRLNSTYPSQLPDGVVIESVALEKQTIRLRLKAPADHSDQKNFRTDTVEGQLKFCGSQTFRPILQKGFDFELVVVSSEGKELVRETLTEATCQAHGVTAPTAESSADSDRVITRDELETIAKTVNTRCPITINDLFSIISVKAADTLTLSIRYRIHRKLNGGTGKNFKARINTLIVAKACEKKSIASMLRSGVTLEYEFVDVDDLPIAKNRLEPGHCDSPQPPSPLVSDLKSTVEFANAACPVKLNDNITMTAVTQPDNATIAYHYQITNPEFLKAIHWSTMKSFMAAFTCRHKNLRETLNAGTRIRYEVAGPDKRFLFADTVSVNQCDGRAATNEAWLKTFVEQQRTKLPMKIDESVTAVAVNTLDDSTLVLRYRITDPESIDILKSGDPTFNRYFETLLVSELCKEPPFSVLLKAMDVSIQYEVVDPKNRLLKKQRLTPRMCDAGE